MEVIEVGTSFTWSSLWVFHGHSHGRSVVAVSSLDRSLRFSRQGLAGKEGKVRYNNCGWTDGEEL